MMKILHTADWHIGKSVNDYSMLEVQRTLLFQLVDYIQHHTIDILIVAGDLYDRAQPSQPAIALVNEVFSILIQDLKIKVLVIAGNHDSPQLIEYGSSIFSTSNLFIEGTAKQTITKVIYDEVDFYLLPFVTPFQFQQVVDTDTIKDFEDIYKYQLSMIDKEFNPNRINVLIAHGYMVSGSLIPDKSESMRPLSIGTVEYVDTSLFSKFDYVALGHIHKPMKLSDNCYYSGALYKYSKSEVNYPIGFNVIDINDREVNIHRELFKLPKDMRIMKGYFLDLLAGQSDDYIFFELEDDSYQLEAMKKLQRRYPNAMGLEYINISQKTTLTMKKTTVENRGVLDLFSEFYTSVLNKELSNKQLEYLIDTLKESEQQ